MSDADSAAHGASSELCVFAGVVVPQGFFSLVVRADLFLPYFLQLADDFTGMRIQ